MRAAILAGVCLATWLAPPARPAWTLYRSGPFDVLTNTDRRAARQVLNELEQIRHVLGQMLGRQDLMAPWPLRVVIGGKNGTAIQPALSRDSFRASLPGATLPPAWRRPAIRLLLEGAPGRLPEAFETGLVDLLSTIDVKETNIFLGAPPEVSRRTPEWARLQYLATAPEYQSRFRVILANLQQGNPFGVALRAALQLSEAELASALTGHIPAAVRYSARPLNADKDFSPRELTPELAALAEAETLLASPAHAAETRRACGALGTPEGQECLGLLALREGNAAEARRMLAAASGPRGKLELARLTRDASHAATAAALKPDWAEAYSLQAELATDGTQRAAHWKRAYSLAPRNAQYAVAAALALAEAADHRESVKAWAQAERATPDPEARQKVRAARLEADDRRLAAEGEQRQAAAEQKQRELQQVKNDSMASILRAQNKANEGLKPMDPNQKVEAWWDGPQPDARTAGVLERVDCLAAGMARLTVRSDSGKPVSLLIREPGKVVIQGKGELTLGCGPQRPPRRVSVQYFAKPDAKLATAGDAAVIDFP
ncbi:MAG: hypothetical protein FJW40_09585 [Acidobacteria bacterium]|nr:hypothetical protein [Acidobacteriota bacterium]